MGKVGEFGTLVGDAALNTNTGKGIQAEEEGEEGGDKLMGSNVSVLNSGRILRARDNDSP